MSKYDLAITRYANTDPRLGRHVNHDSRNLAYTFPEPATAQLVAIRHHSSLPITDQGSVGACVGFSTVDILGYDKYWTALSKAQQSALLVNPNASGLLFYSVATQLDSIKGTYPPNDTGSDGPSGAKALQKQGLTNGYQHSVSWASFTAALQTGPVMVGTVWYESMMDSASDGKIDVDPNSGVAGGHEYCADEITSDGFIGFRNHWTQSWGIQGRFYISQTAFKLILADQGDVTVPTPLTAPAPTPTPTPTPTPIAVDKDVLAAYSSLKSWAKRNNVS